MVEVCIDWYWQTYVDGVLVDEEYLYTTCSGGGGGGSGGGGGATPPSPPCNTAPINQASVSGNHVTINSTGTHLIINFIPPPDDPCDENTGHAQDPDFGEDDPTQCLNCRIADANFDDYLEYQQSLGNTVYYPYPDSFTYNGVAYDGMITEIDGPNGKEYYFTPNTNSAVFQTGNQYRVGNTSGTTLPSVVYGNISYLGSASGSFSPPAGTGSGGRNVNTGHAKVTLIEDPTTVNWSTPDNVILTDPNPITYAQYQSTTPWPTVANIIPYAQFVSYDGRNCLTLSRDQIGKMGYTCSGWLPNSQTFQIYTSANVANLPRTKQAITYVISALQAGIPVVAAVDAFPGTSTPKDKNGDGIDDGDGITDHFISIDGMGTDSKGKYFHFVDNSTSNPSTGDYYANRLYYDETTGKISGKCNTGYTTQAHAVGGHDYIVTQIRKSIKKALPVQ